MKLVIAEKNVLARDIARAICGKSVNDKTPLPISGNGYIVFALSGHLLELVEPELIDSKWAFKDGSWGIEDLPIWYPNWPRDIRRAIDDKGRKSIQADEYAQKKIDALADLLPQADCVICAGDPDDEGQALVDEVIDFLGWEGETWRVYINDSIEKNIRKAFKNLKPNDACRGDGLAAYARSMADAAFGYNESRLLSSRLRIANASLGRVQTPTLGMVVNRDRAVEAHTERMYYELYIALDNNSFSKVIDAKFLPNKEFLEQFSEDEKHIFDRKVLVSQADKILANKKLELVVKHSKEEKTPPLPYNFTSLASDMNAKYGYPVDKVLSITQDLRNKYSAITYNRTPSSYLKLEHHQEADVVLGVALKNIDQAWPLDFSIKSKAFDDSKVTNHHGIIPQEVSLDCSSMTEEELNVYRAIVERYAAQFLPNALYDVCIAGSALEDGRLRYKARKLTSPGWLKYVKEIRSDDTGTADDDGDEFIPQGTYYVDSVGSHIKEKKTTPPKRYTEGTLIKDMASISKYVKDKTLKAALKKKDEDDPDEHGGIGTSATRSTIIETLKKRGFLELQGKNIVSTQRGRAVWDLVPDDIRNGAEITARWYLVQEDIRIGKLSPNAIGEDVCKRFLAHRDSAYIGVEVPSILSGNGRVSFGVCPKCGQPVFKAKSSYQCSSNKFEEKDGAIVRVSGCGWRMYSTVANKKLTDNQVSKIISGKRVKVSGLTNKQGKKFDAYLSLKSDDSGDIEFSFEGISKKKSSGGRRNGF